MSIKCNFCNKKTKMPKAILLSIGWIAYEFNGKPLKAGCKKHRNKILQEMFLDVKEGRSQEEAEKIVADAFGLNADKIEQIKSALRIRGLLEDESQANN